jgi:glycosyltransferase involved in cell wall biosynthesis
MDLVSIITPNYNRADVIKETAASIFKQTDPNWEWVIVDDGSTDESLDVLQEFAKKDSRVKVLQRSRLPKGAAACRNIAIENCSGDYLIFLDSDDVLASFCVEQRLKAARENPEYDFLIFPLLLFKNKPDDLGLLWNIENETDDATRTMLGDPICQGTGTIWKKQSFVAIGMWDETLLLWQDVELHIRTFLSDLKYRKLLNLPPDIFIRISDVSLSRTGFNSLPKFKSRVKVYTDTLKLAEQHAVIDKYRKGLIYMGFELICSAIHSNHFAEADQLLKLNKAYELFDADMMKRIKIFYWAKRFKLYKLPLLKKLSIRPKTDYNSNYRVTLNKVKYQENIQV